MEISRSLKHDPTETFIIIETREEYLERAFSPVDTDRAYVITAHANGLEFTDSPIEALLQAAEWASDAAEVIRDFMDDLPDECECEGLRTCEYCRPRYPYTRDLMDELTEFASACRSDAALLA